MSSCSGGFVPMRSSSAPVAARFFRLVFDHDAGQIGRKRLAACAPTRVGRNLDRLGGLIDRIVVIGVGGEGPQRRVLGFIAFAAGAELLCVLEPKRPERRRELAR